MPKLKGRIPRITFREVQPLKLRDQDWLTIERTYGHSIPLEARAQITVATNRFLQLAQAENTGLISEAVKRVNRLLKRIQWLHACINERHPEDVTRAYVDDQIAVGYSLINVDDPAGKRFPTRNYISGVSHELMRFAIACDTVTESLPTLKDTTTGRKVGHGKYGFES